MSWKFFNSSGQEIVSDTVADSSITLAKMAANSIDSTQYVDASIDLTHMSVNSIDSNQYVDGSIDRVHLAADIIDGTKIADDVINSEHYAAASIDNEHLADDAVGIAELSATGTASSSTFLRGDNSWVAAGGIASVVADTTPQLGGNLDMQARLLVGNGGSTGIAISANGEVTMAAQPAVLAFNTSLDSNVTGNGATFTVDYDDEIFDQNSDFTNDTFTAPITGRYCVMASAGIEGRTTAHKETTINILSSNRNIRQDQAWSIGILGTCASIISLVDMDASDTFTITVRNQGESGNVHDIRTGGEGTQVSVFLMG